MTLNDIYGNIPGRKILSHFDLVVANSGGSIVLGGLIENKTPQEIIQLFTDQKSREAVFAPLPFWRRQLARIPVLPKYSTEGKLAGLQKLLQQTGRAPLCSFSGPDWVKNDKGADVKILIVTYGFDSQRSAFFRSYATSNGGTADKVPLADAINASSTAPIIYFDKPAEWKSLRSWDGAMAGLNNPVMAGIGEMMSEGIDGRNIAALSIGTGTVKLVPSAMLPTPPKELAHAPDKSGILPDFRKAASSILDDPPDSATYLAHLVLSSAQGRDPREVGPVVRLSPLISPVLINDTWQVPPGITAAQFQALTRIDMDATKDDEINLIKALGNAWIAGQVRNQPVRLNNCLAAAPGESYAEGKSRWQKMEVLQPL
jgi:hypothetical protein